MFDSCRVRGSGNLPGKRDSFDFSFQFGESCFQRLPYLIRDHLVDNNPNLASAYKKLEKALNKSLTKILGKAYDLE